MRALDAVLVTLFQAFCISYAFVICKRKKQKQGAKSLDQVSTSIKTAPSPLFTPQGTSSQSGTVKKGTKSSDEKPETPNEKGNGQADDGKPSGEAPKSSEKPIPAAPKNSDESVGVKKADSRKSQKQAEENKEEKPLNLPEVINKQNAAAAGPRGIEVDKSIKKKKKDEKKKEEKNKSEKTQVSSGRKFHSNKDASKKEKPKPAVLLDQHENMDEDEDDDETMKGIQSLKKDPNIPSSVDDVV
ncbi:hypothetical protein L596_015982 [Steinernema carpocapsae]|uniref:Uncharacterized protein n=1 Tax=Steinernema carpocapsae TaxID=34508 RepID=A0A4U5NGM9_STECR|nr:hypothetical protein L596_015982 [Steinernema carpocapsae]